MKKQVLLPQWMFNESTKTIFSIIQDNLGEARFVGGCVRDMLLEKQAEDIDIATTLVPDVVSQIFYERNIRTVKTGIKHGTLTIIIDGKSFEVTTLREDKDCDGRHANIKCTTEWCVDATRRDFTFNALYCDMDGNIYDYYSGLEDLKNRRLKFVNDPECRIQEDYLRILRAFRFYNSLCYETELDQNILLACAKFAQNIDILSGERIQIEILKMLNYNKHGKLINTLKYMKKCGVLSMICLDITLPKIIPIYLLGNDQVLAFLIRQSNDPQHILSKIADRWKLSKNFTKSLKFLLGKFGHPTKII